MFENIVPYLLVYPVYLRSLQSFVQFVERPAGLFKSHLFRLAQVPACRVIMRPVHRQPRRSRLPCRDTYVPFQNHRAG